MSLFRKELSYLYVLAESLSVEQIKKFIQFTTPSQYNLLRTGARLILDETVPLTKSEFDKLEPQQNFIRNLAAENNQLTPRKLANHVSALVLIASKVVKYYEACSESGSHSSVGLGSNQDKRERANSWESRSSQDESSSTEGSSSDTRVESGEEEEEEQGENKRSTEKNEFQF